MIELFIIILLVGLSTASTLLFISKPNWGRKDEKYSLIDLYQAYRKEWMPERCEPCFSLWIGFLLLVLLTPFYGTGILLGALAVPPIAVFFYSIIKSDKTE